MDKILKCPVIITCFNIDLKSLEITFTSTLENFIGTTDLGFQNYTDFFKYIDKRDIDKFLSILEIKEHKPMYIRLIDDEKSNWVKVICNNDGKSVDGIIINVDFAIHSDGIQEIIRNASSDYFFNFDIKSGDVIFNDNFLKLLDFKGQKDFDIRKFLTLFGEQNSKNIMTKYYEQVKDKQENFAYELETNNIEGEKIWLSMNAKIKYDLSGEPIFLAGVITDITQQKYEKTVSDLIMDAPIGIPFIFDLKADEMEFSEKILDILELETVKFNDALAMWLSFIVSEDANKYIESLRNAINHNEEFHSFEFRLESKSGREVWVASRSTIIRDEDNEATMLVGTILDIETMGVFNTFIDEQVMCNKLTGLPNRELFIYNLKRRLAEKNKTGYIVLLNLDNFKSINSIYSHSIGDKVLKRYGKIFSEKTNENCDLYHFGGDVFVFILDEYKENECLEFMENLKQLSTYGILEKNNHIVLTFSLAAAAFKNDADIEHIFMCLEMGIDQIKSNGKNNYLVFNEENLHEYFKKLELEAELKKSIENNFEGFGLLYQPIFWGKTLTLVGAEVFMYYKTNSGQIINSREFFSMLEKSGLIIKLENWMFETSMKALNRWNKISDNYLFSISLYVSDFHLNAKYFEDNFIEIVKKHNILPYNISLRVSEKTLAVASENGIEILEKIRSAGIGVFINDFGFGYSSLSYFKTLPINGVKIHKSFIEDLVDDSSNLMFVNAIVQMARSLKYSVCIKGIDYESQLEKVSNLGVEFFEGDYLGKKLEYEDFEKKYFFKK